MDSQIKIEWTYVDEPEAQSFHFVKKEYQKAEDGTFQLVKTFVYKPMDGGLD